METYALFQVDLPGRAAQARFDKSLKSGASTLGEQVGGPRRAPEGRARRAALAGP